MVFISVTFSKNNSIYGNKTVKTTAV